MLHLNRNKTKTSKVGAISKAQKAQNIFWEKNLKHLNFSLEKCRIVPKNVKGPFLIYKQTFCCKITKNSEGALKIFRKVAQCRKKSTGFVGYLEKVKNERGDP